ncbi:MAG: ribonuclease HI family protein [Patescibacteria group bacterium]|nr:ribonuclease HI family protein [Patescibacteria group bacterium]
MKIIIFSDGGARGNPGPAGIGCVIQNANLKSQISKYIGTTTNNQAEYTAVIEALKWVIANHTVTATSQVAVEVEFFLDSELVVEQLNGRYKVKNEGLKPLFWQIRDLIMQLGGKVTFKHIPREQNKEADKLVNLAIDKKSEILNPKSETN